MGTTTRLTLEEFQNLPEREGVHYELDDGELLMEASPAARGQPGPPTYRNEFDSVC